ncbi:hypothetical protein A6A04_06790 [Paramagnetospirillum marisnigri]|uniref:histidine kinase n=1 Tax=Paramagnetospirillum marisnigri TaxID=1285242 RepID=A0A178MC53_9PROT|nr:PAS domain-containing protein [Paramagnetospirillum marisnigri]OAN45598.1 hypothetical protein A6A04_06790 [Paramagnetospirillum marisnigri]
MFVLLNLFVISLVGLVLFWHLEHERTKATQTAASLSHVLEQNLSRFVDKIDLTLMAVADEVERQERAGGIHRPTLEAFLARHDSRLPEALGLRVVSAKGMIEYAVGNTTIASQANISDREHFTRHRDDPKLGLFVSQPIIGRLNPQPMLIFARKRTAPDGSFGGIVHVAVAVSSLSAMFSSVDVGPAGSVGLWNDMPLLLARHSLVPGPSSGVATPSADLRRLVETRAPPQPYTTLSGVDGLERIFFYRQVEHHPLFLVVGMASSDYLAAWRREATYLGGLATLFLLGSIAAALTIRRSVAALIAARADADSARRRSDLVLASVGDGICGVDSHGRVTFVNQAARRMLGWGEDEGLGQDLHDVTHHHHADGTPYPSEHCPVREVLSGSPLAPLVRHVGDEMFWRKDGSGFPVEYTAAAVVEDDRVIGAVNVFRDITERKRAEAEAARTLATTQVLGNCLRLSLEDISLDQVLDLALKELLWLPWLTLENRGCIFVLESGRLRMAARRNLPQEIVASCASIDIGHCLCGKAAALRDTIHAACVDSGHHVRYEGMPDHGHYCIPIMAGGELLGVLNTYVTPGHRRDEEEERFLRLYAHTLAGIIKRKRAEEKLRASEELAKTLVNAPADAALLMDTGGTILAANQALANRFGTEAGSLVGKTLFDLLSPEQAEAQRQLLQKMTAEKTPLHTHEELDGIYLDNRIYPVLDPGGKVVQVAVFSRDVTEQREAARAIQKGLEDLERSNAELEQFAYVTSHDLRQPLRMVSGYLALIQRRMGDTLDPDIKDFIGFAVGGAKRMDALIVDLLDYARIGRGDIPFEPLPLADVLADVRANLDMAVQDAGGELVVSGSPLVVAGDRSELSRLFQNLIGNALKYRSPERAPRVEVSWTQEGDRAEVAVADNGMGIAAEDYDRAFGIFKRLVTGDQVEGTGIGLAICKKIVERHGGRIWIESEPGVGTTFRFTLPLHSE